MTDTPALDAAHASYAPYVNTAGATGVIDGYSAQLAEIDGNPGLTEAGKKTESARAYLEAEEQLGRYKATLAANIDTARSNHERALFGPGSTVPGEVVAHRDALDRAFKLRSDKDAVDAVQRARFSGDTGSIRAITLQANKKGWGDTLAAIEKAAPGTGDKLAKYKAIPDAEGLKVDTAFRLPKPNYFKDPTPGAARASMVLAAKR